MSNSTIYKNVMRRVQTIHALRTAASGTGISFILFFGSLYLIGREVWVARVWENMPSVVHVNALVHFFTSAFLHTNITVQILLLLSISALVWMIREITRVLLVVPFRYA